jgi:hypothetical protein
MSSVKTTQLDGDVSVGRNTSIGGSLTIQGGGRVKGTFVIDGWLDAKNIKSSNKGIFTTVEKLREAFPRPHDGWWAIVGKSLPSPIYVGDGGAWVATGESGGTPMLEDANGALQQAINDAKNKANEAKKAIEDMVSSLPIAQEAGDSATSVMSQKAVTEAISPLEKKTPIDTIGDGLYVSDKFGNIVMKIDSNGFDVAKLSAHFFSLLAPLINIPVFETKESGFYVTDANLNIGFQVNSEHNNYLQFKY